MWALLLGHLNHHSLILGVTFLVHERVRVSDAGSLAPSPISLSVLFCLCLNPSVSEYPNLPSVVPFQPPPQPLLFGPFFLRCPFASFPPFSFIGPLPLHLSISAVSPGVFLSSHPFSVTEMTLLSPLPHGSSTFSPGASNHPPPQAQESFCLLLPSRLLLMIKAQTSHQ